MQIYDLRTQSFYAICKFTIFCQLKSTNPVIADPDSGGPKTLPNTAWKHEKFTINDYLPYEDVIFGDVVLALGLGLELLAAVLAGGEEGVLLQLRLRL